MKKLCSAILALVCSVCMLSVPVSAEEVAASARSYVLYCADNGEVLLSHNMNERLPMASTTKIMTTLLALEHADRDNATVTFTQDMIAEGSSMYLQPGEKVTLRDLAVGMMMQSGNDAANAAALTLADSYGDFADMMNARAQQLGMKDTHFVTPSGLDDEQHYSTARDMAVLMACALENASFKEITAQTDLSVDFIDPPDKRVSYHNHNRLLSLYPDCIGGKTGYTDAAGRCLVTAAQRDGLTLIAVTLDDGNDWNDHMALYDYGFSHYGALTPDDATFRVPVVGGTTDSLTAFVGVSAPVVVPADRTDDVVRRVYLPPFLYAPVRRGQPVGRVTYLLDGEALYEADLTAADNVSYNGRRRGLIEYIKDLVNWHS